MPHTREGELSDRHNLVRLVCQLDEQIEVLAPKLARARQLLQASQAEVASLTHHQTYDREDIARLTDRIQILQSRETLYKLSVTSAQLELLHATFCRFEFCEFEFPLSSTGPIDDSGPFDPL